MNVKLNCVWFGRNGGGDPNDCISHGKWHAIIYFVYFHVEAMASIELLDFISSSEIDQSFFAFSPSTSACWCRGIDSLLLWLFHSLFLPVSLSKFDRSPLDIRTFTEMAHIYRHSITRSATGSLGIGHNMQMYSKLNDWLKPEINYEYLVASLNWNETLTLHAAAIFSRMFAFLSWAKHKAHFLQQIECRWSLYFLRWKKYCTIIKYLNCCF